MVQHISMPVQANHHAKFGGHFNKWLVENGGLDQLLQHAPARVAAREIEAFIRSYDDTFVGYSVGIANQPDSNEVRIIVNHSPALRALCPVCAVTTHERLLAQASFKMHVEEGTYARMSLVGKGSSPMPITPGVLNPGDETYLIRWETETPVLYYDFIHRVFFEGTFLDTVGTKGVRTGAVERFEVDDIVRYAYVRDQKGRTIRAVSAVCPQDQDVPIREGVFVVSCHPAYKMLCEFNTFAFLQG